MIRTRHSLRSISPYFSALCMLFAGISQSAWPASTPSVTVDGRESATPTVAQPAHASERAAISPAEAAAGMPTGPVRTARELSQLLRASADSQEFRGRMARGVARRIELEIPIPKSALAPQVTHQEVARAVLAQWHSILGISDPTAELRAVKQTGFNGRSLDFEQVHHEIPVYGSWVRVTVDENEQYFRVRHIKGRTIPDLTLPQITPLITVERAMEIAGVSPAARPKGPPGGSEPATLGTQPLNLRPLIVPAKLWIYDQALFASSCPHCPKVDPDPRLSWRLIFESAAHGGAVTDAFVDATTGELLRYQPRIHEDLKLRIATANNNRVNLCVPKQSLTDAWYDEDGVCRFRLFHCSGNACSWEAPICANPDAEGQAAFDNASRIWDFYDQAFQPASEELFGSIDDVDFITESERFWIMLDACRSDPSTQCPNWENAASVHCTFHDSHVFGDGMAVMDVMAHEVGHTYHWSHVEFVYSDESGAIAEHIADILGHFAGCWTGVDCNWQHGEAAISADAAGCGRNLADPPVCTAFDPVLSVVVNHPDHFSLYHVTTWDDGGVHINNGILNKAAYLMVQGGLHPQGLPGLDTVRITGLGEDKVRALYHASIFSLPETLEFVDFAEHLYDTCLLLGADGMPGFRGNGLTSADCCQVRNAFAAVGVGPSDLDCDGNEDTDPNDRDGDGVDDSADNAPWIPNPGQDDIDVDGTPDVMDEDIDGDTILNTVDNCPEVPNTNQRDINRNNIGDACEDFDGDGVINAADNCIYDPNRDQADNESDGVGDECDSDDDNDGIPDNTPDNCPFTANTNQINSDSDPYGDACDNCDSLANDQTDTDDDGIGDACDQDIDGDGVINVDDNCPDTAGDTSCESGHLWNGNGCPCGEAYLPFDEPPQPPPEFWYPFLYFIPINPGMGYAGAIPPGSQPAMEFDVSLDLPAHVRPNSPIGVDVVVLDETGRRVATDRIELVFDADNARGRSRAQLFLGHRTNLAGSFADSAPRPTHFLHVAPRFEDEKDLGLVAGRRLRIRPRTEPPINRNH
jgi:hypothetical protein